MYLCYYLLSTGKCPVVKGIMNMKNTLLKIFCLVFMLLFNAIPSFAGDLHFQIYSPDTNTVIKTDLDENDVRNFSRKRDSYGERIDIKFNKAGAVKLKKLTTEHVGKELAIQHFNTEFLFSAKIMEPVDGGEISITSSDLNFDSLEQGLIQAGLKKEQSLFEKLLPVIGIALILLMLSLLVRNIIQLFKKYGATFIIKKLSLYVFAPLLCVGLVGGIVFTIHKGIESVTLPTCDSKFAEEQVLEIFKLHNSEYKDNVEQGLLGELRFSDPVPQSYDKEIKKYECSGRVTMYPKNGLLKYGYARKENKVGICDVHYSIYKEHGKNTVRANSCNTAYDDIRWREF